MAHGPNLAHGQFFVNKVLFGYHHVRSFRYCLWLLLWYDGRVEHLQQRWHWPLIWGPFLKWADAWIFCFVLFFFPFFNGEREVQSCLQDARHS